MSTLPTLDLLTIMAAGRLSGISISDTVWFQDGDVVGLFRYDDGERSVKFDSTWPPAQQVYNDSSIESQRKFVYDLFAPGEAACDIVAVLILPSNTVAGDAAEPKRVAVDYLTVDRLNQFLLSGSFVGDCLLSKYVVPSAHHSLVYCVYGGDRLLGVEHRMNRNLIHNRSLPVVDRTCTSGLLPALSHKVELSTGSLGRLAKIVEKLAFGVRQLGCELDRLSFFLCVTPPVAGGVVGRYVLLCASESPAPPPSVWHRTKRESVIFSGDVDADEAISWGPEGISTGTSQRPPLGTGVGRSASASVARLHGGRSGANAASGAVVEGRCTRPLTSQEVRQALRSGGSSRSSHRAGSGDRDKAQRMTNEKLFRPELSSPQRASPTRPTWNSSTVVTSQLKPHALDSSLSLSPQTANRSPDNVVDATDGGLGIRQPIDMFVHDLQDACLMGYLTRPHHIPSHLQGSCYAVPPAVEAMASPSDPIAAVSTGSGDQGSLSRTAPAALSITAALHAQEEYETRYDTCESTRLLRATKHRLLLADLVEASNHERSTSSRSGGLSAALATYNGTASLSGAGGGGGGGGDGVSVVTAAGTRVDDPHDTQVGVAADVTASSTTQRRFNVVPGASRALSSVRYRELFRKKWLDLVLENAVDDAAVGGGNLGHGANGDGFLSGDEPGLFDGTENGVLSFTSYQSLPMTDAYGSPRRTAPASPGSPGSPVSYGSPRTRFETAIGARSTLGGGNGSTVVSAKFLSDLDRPQAEVLAEYRSMRQGNSATAANASAAAGQVRFSPQHRLAPSPSADANASQRRSLSSLAASPSGTGTPRRNWLLRQFDPQALSELILESFYSVYSAELTDKSRSKDKAVRVVIDSLPAGDAREASAWLRRCGVDANATLQQQGERQNDASALRSLEMTLPQNYTSLSHLRGRIAKEAAQLMDFIAGLSKPQWAVLGPEMEAACFCSRMASRRTAPNGGGNNDASIDVAGGVEDESDKSTIVDFLFAEIRHQDEIRSAAREATAALDALRHSDSAALYAEASVSNAAVMSPSIKSLSPSGGGARQRQHR